MVSFHGDGQKNKSYLQRENIYDPKDHSGHKDTVKINGGQKGQETVLEIILWS